ncbi:MAG TPA: DUF4180 domain-containing protein [Bryobacteraceae bacterium]|nr:DUF4180 domain-containing protein [Bryobacteraceae bacterium]
MMLQVSPEGGFVEGAPDQSLMLRPEDASLVIEACFSVAVRAAVLYPANLTPEFFDLSSGEAGAILQKLRNYRIRVAVVCPPGTVSFSTRFGEMAEEETRGKHFGFVDSRDAAREWLKKT